MGEWISEKKAITTLLTSTDDDKERERERERGKKQLLWRPPSSGPLFSRSNKKKGVFGQSLMELYEVSTSPVPLFVLQCIMFLKASGALKAEGIFRVSGLKEVIESGKELFQTATDVFDLSVHIGDPNAVASLLKTFYRELSEPLFTFDLSLEAYELMQRIPPSQEADRIQAMKTLVTRLPLIHAINARFLFEFLHTITIYSTTNLMSPRNLSIVWGPNLFRTAEVSIAIVSSQFDVSATEILITSYDDIFDGVGVGSLKVESRAEESHNIDSRFRSPRKLKKGTHDKQPKVRRTGSDVTTKRDIKSSEVARSHPNGFRMVCEYTATHDGELSFSVGDEVILTSPNPSLAMSEDSEKGSAVGLFGLLTTRTAKNVTTGQEGTISEKFLPAHVIASTLPPDRAEVVHWPITSQDDVVECKTVVKRSKTVQEYLRSVAIRSAVDVSDLQIGRLQYVPLKADESLLDALENGGTPLVIVRNGKITETICVTPNS